HMLILVDRGDYWQAGFGLRKGAYAEVRAEGLDSLRARVAQLAHRSGVPELRTWDDVKLLTVKVDRLRRWYRPGLLFIGDAAHAMSPMGGVGINLAIQDAVAAANILAEPLRARRLTTADLARVQRRRSFPTRATQRVQVLLQNHLVKPVVEGAATNKLPGLIRLVRGSAWLRRL